MPRSPKSPEPSHRSGLPTRRAVFSSAAVVAAGAVPAMAETRSTVCSPGFKKALTAYRRAQAVAERRSDRSEQQLADDCHAWDAAGNVLFRTPTESPADAAVLAQIAFERIAEVTLWLGEDDFDGDAHVYGEGLDQAFLAAAIKTLGLDPFERLAADTHPQNTAIVGAPQGPHPFGDVDGTSLLIDAMGGPVACAERFGVSEATVRDWVTVGIIPRGLHLTVYLATEQLGRERVLAALGEIDAMTGV